jgi:hypothetical protein
LACGSFKAKIGAGGAAQVPWLPGVGLYTALQVRHARISHRGAYQRSSPFRIEVLMKIRWLIGAAGCLAIAVAVSKADDWPQWHGARRDNINTETGLLKSWPKEGPKLLWTCKSAGFGLSSIAVVGDTFYTMGADAKDEYLLAFEVGNAKPKWKTKIGDTFTFKLNYWGEGPRGTPTVDGDFVYGIGGQGDLVCVRRANGDPIWKKSFTKDFNGQVMEYAPPMNWGFCESPLIDGDSLICCPGGKDGWMVCLDKKDGKLRWRTKEITDQAADSSAVIAEIDGVRQIVQCSYKGADGGGLVGVEPKTGKVLWYALNPKFNVYSLCPTPIVKGRLIYTHVGEAENGSCHLHEVSKNAAGKFEAKNIYGRPAQKVMKNVHGGVILVGDVIFGYSETLGWICQDFKTGEAKWEEKERFGKGTLTCADGMLYLLSEGGEVMLIPASTKEWEEKGKFALPALSKSREERRSHSQVQVWTHPVVANGRLYVRDQELIYCYDVRAPK